MLSISSPSAKLEGVSRGEEGEEGDGVVSDLVALKAGFIARAIPTCANIKKLQRKRKSVQTLKLFACIFV
ncbi:MAG: hypothetical protein HQK52_01230 [Oligoflexia bacterium]|nr:hypothetical protein [Oligoflexia bacterium]